MEGVLSRREMRSIMAGGGNIYCNSGGNIWSCTNDSLLECTQICAELGECEGCAQFPAHQQ